MTTEEKELTYKSKKNDIWTAYKNVLEELEKKSSEGNVLFKMEDEGAKIVEKTKNYKADTMEKHIKDFGKSFTDGVISLQEKMLKEFGLAGEKLSEELAKLEEIREAIKIEESRLKDVYGLKNASISLIDFLESVEKEKQKWKELENERRLQNKREEEEYVYVLQKKRKEEDDKYEAAQKAKKDGFESDIKSRLEKVEESERMLGDLEKELAELRIFKETYEMKTIDVEKIKLEFETKDQIDAQKHKSELELKTQSVVNLQNMLKQKDEEIGLLRKKADLAEQRSQNLAISVVESKRVKSCEERSDSSE